MDTSWTVTIDDTSSFINYHPQGDGGVGDWTSTGWQPWFSDSGGFNSAGGEDGTGTSLHITAFPGASLDFQFYGTSVALYGTANCSYEVSVDGASSSFGAKDGELYAQDNLHEQMHRVSLTAHASNSSMFSFDRADVSRPLAAGTSPPTAVVYQATNTTFVQYTGGWKQQMDPNGQIPNKEHPAPYYEVDDPPASLSFSFEGTGVAVNGSRNWGSFTYDVTLDGNTNTYNASTMWLIGDALLFYQDGLDPHSTHTVNITPKVGGGDKFWLNSITVLSDSSSDSTAGQNNASSTISGSSATQSPSSLPTSNASSSSTTKKTNPGLIVGPIIGAIAILSLLAGLLWWYLHKRRPSTSRAALTEAQYSPFAAPPSASAAPLMRNASANASRVSKLSRFTAEGGSVSRVSPYESATMPPALPASPPTSDHASNSTWGRSTVVGPQAAAGVMTAAAALAPAQQQAAAAGPPPADSQAALDRLAQLIADRLDRTHVPRSEYASSEPPPEYGA
ncbi:hypothetical protein OH77DRAFT_393081 [Trametes cingulata]|nr:hypothetical protein OH77DRAFT_393081 [Trametes cingulata]